MADPVTNVEIEDVLSSIRRLVSDEARAPSRADKDDGFHSDKPPQPVELEAETLIEDTKDEPHAIAPALVLTAALRVETPPETTVSDPVEESAKAPVESIPIEDTLILMPTAEPENMQENTASVAGESESFEGEYKGELQNADEVDNQDISEVAGDLSEETSETVADTDPSFEDAAPTEHEESAAEEAQNENTFEPEAHNEQSEEEPLSIEDKIAALETLIGHSETDFEPDGAEAGGNAARRGDALPWVDSDEGQSAKGDIALPDPDRASQNASFNEATIAFQRAHSEAVGSAQEELQANVTETLLDSDDQTGLLDEEALRDMVAEIVRQELQGPLGERITRNVRKLVRREIYRALAANELD